MPKTAVVFHGQLEQVLLLVGQSTALHDTW